jgi:hypothetical protein
MQKYNMKYGTFVDYKIVVAGEASYGDRPARRGKSAD